MRLFLIGWFGAGNMGDEAILVSMIVSIRQTLPGVQFDVLSFGDAVNSSLPLAQSAGVNIVRMGSRSRVWCSDFQGFWRALRLADLVVIGGGGLFQDLYNPYPVPFFTATVLLAKLLGKRVMFYALGIGPLHRRWARWLTGLAAKVADLITTRDAESAALLEKLGLQQQMYVTADPVLLLPPVSSELAAQILAKEGGQDRSPRIGVSVHSLLTWGMEQKRALAGALDCMVNAMNVQIVFIPFGCYHDQWIHPGVSRTIDRMASEDIAALMTRESIVLAGHYTPQEMLAIIGQMDLVLSMRFHGLVMAVNMGVPPIALTHRCEIKLRNFMKRLEQEDNVLEVNTVSQDDLFDRMRHVLTNKEQLRLDLQKQAENLKDQAQKNVLLLSRLLVNEKSGNEGNQL